MKETKFTIAEEEKEYLSRNTKCIQILAHVEISSTSVCLSCPSVK